MLLREHTDPYPELRNSAIEKFGGDYWECTDLHAPAVLDSVRRLAPRYILLSGAPVVRPELFGLAREGALNRHVGLAPFYRGSDCLLWALARNEPHRVGFTIHFVVEKVDAGDILVQQAVPFRPGLSLAQYIALVQRTASDAYVATSDALVRGEAVPRQRQTGSGLYFPPATLSTLVRAVRNYARLTRA